MDYVYICRSGPNEELRYSIRSVLKNTTHGNIWVVGDKPDWYRGNFVSIPDIGNKYANIRNCLMAIPQIGAISEEFVMIEDDMFIVKEMGRVPVFHGGLLYDRIDYLSSISPDSQYVRKLKATYNYLIKRGVKRPINYDVHIPLVMEKSKLAESLDHEVFPRSVYGNLNNIGGVYTEDVKVHLSGAWEKKSYDFRTGSLAFISTEESDSFEAVYKEVLKEMFPEKSQYEMD
jgi:hypothetical protein